MSSKCCSHSDCQTDESEDETLCAESVRGDLSPAPPPLKPKRVQSEVGATGASCSIDDYMLIVREKIPNPEEGGTEKVERLVVESDVSIKKGGEAGTTLHVSIDHNYQKKAMS